MGKREDQCRIKEKKKGEDLVSVIVPQLIIMA
jgi:hypothetical protein